MVRFYQYAAEWSDSKTQMFEKRHVELCKHRDFHWARTFAHRKLFSTINGSKNSNKLFSSSSNRQASVTRMSPKIIVLFVIALCCVQSSFAAEADWEVLNFAISNPGQSNPAVLKNSILNILGSFFPAAPVTAAPAPTTAAPTPAPTGLLNDLMFT